MPNQRELLVSKMVAEGTSDEDIRATLKTFDAQQRTATPATPEGSAVGRFASNLGAALNPVTAVKGLAEAVRHPVNTYNALVDASAQQFGQARDAYAQGRYSEAVGHGAAGFLPAIGPAAASAGEQIGRGDVAGGLGATTGLLAPFGAGPAIGAARRALPARAAAAVNPTVEFARARGIPLDAATVSDNFAVKGAQAIADRSLAGGAISRAAKAKQAGAMSRVGDELLDTAHPGIMTPEMAGTSIREALTTKITGHGQSANVAYDKLRLLEEQRGPLPVHLEPVKAALRPIREQMERQLPITQQQANPGLKALQNILDGPEFGSLSQIDRDLSTLKTVAREQGGLAKFAVAQLESAVSKAATAGGPDVVQALKAGREATKAKYAASDVLDTLHAEPVKSIDALIAPRDTAIQRLRAVVAQAPDQVPVIARASLEKVLESPQRVANWHKLGAETKATLFPNAAHVQALDRFFDLTDRMSKTNVNPSGSGYVALLGGQGAMLWTHPTLGVPLQIGSAALAKLLRSQAAIDALTDGLRMPTIAAASTRAKLFTRLSNAAAQVGVQLTPETP